MKTLNATELETIIARAFDVCDEPIMELVLPADLFNIDITNIPVVAPTHDCIAAPTLAPAGPSRRSTKVSIRIPERTLTAFRAQAARKKIPYQTLVNQVLRAAAAGWAPL